MHINREIIVKKYRMRKERLFHVQGETFHLYYVGTDDTTDTWWEKYKYHVKTFPQFSHDPLVAGK